MELILLRKEAELFLVSYVQFVNIYMLQAVEQRLKLIIIILLNFLVDFLGLLCFISGFAALGVSTVFVTGAISADKGAQCCRGTSRRTIGRAETSVQSRFVLSIGRIGHSDIASCPRTSRVAIGSHVHGDTIRLNSPGVSSVARLILATTKAQLSRSDAWPLRGRNWLDAPLVLHLFLHAVLEEQTSSLLLFLVV